MRIIPPVIIEEFKTKLNYPQSPLGTFIDKKVWQTYAFQVRIRDMELRRVVRLWYESFDSEKNNG